jgi:hypothetical protein
MKIPLFYIIPSKFKIIFNKSRKQLKNKAAHTLPNGL